MSPSAAVVDIRGLRVRAGNRELLADVTMRVGGGERVAVVGANGAGKTTLLRAMTGFVRPSDGTVDVLGCRLGAPGDRVSLRRLRTRVGQVFQGLHLVARLTAIENVLIGGLAREGLIASCLRRFSERERQEATEALRAVGMEHAAPVRTDRLSGGERQKVAIARALHQRPQLILADEPTANLDPSAAAEVAKLLSDACSKRGLTLITVVHTLTLLPSIADRVIGLHTGRVAFDRPAAAFGEPETALLYERTGAGSAHD